MQFCVLQELFNSFCLGIFVLAFLYTQEKMNV